MLTKVYVDPACNINYSSFYLTGLRQIYGRRNVVFTSRFFKGLHYTTDCHIMAFVIDGKKYAIDYADSNKLFFDDFLEWADVYGKVNYKRSCLPAAFSAKIVHVGANFGIACYGTTRFQALMWCIWHYALCRKRLNYPFSSFLSPYLWVCKRSMWQNPSLSFDPKYIFMISRYWNGQDEVNRSRINFIRACKRLDQEGVVHFTGGMVPDHVGNDCPHDVLLQDEISYKDYLVNLNRSLLVFNTPAYHNCHGWKLPEYISQGKIILSTPFVNELPVPMEHGKHVFFTQADEFSIYESIKEIVGNKILQETLTNGSASYWKQYANFELCMRSFLTDGSV